MSDVDIEDLARRLVIGRKRDGRNVYDPLVRRELIEECLRPGASVTKLAKGCGINASQLGRWVREHQRAKPSASTVHQGPSQKPPKQSASPFVPVPLQRPLAPQREVTVDAQARLPNGVIVDLQGCELQQMCLLIGALGRLTCSVSTKG